MARSLAPHSQSLNLIAAKTVSSASSYLLFTLVILVALLVYSRARVVREMQLYRHAVLKANPMM